VHVVDDPLDVSRLEAMVQDVMQSRPEATTRGRLQLESAQSELRGCWDSDRLARVLINLVSNAIKYSPLDETVTVRARKTTSRADHILCCRWRSEASVFRRTSSRASSISFTGPAMLARVFRVRGLACGFRARSWCPTVAH
jgi:signal transduction histidine kinase